MLRTGGVVGFAASKRFWIREIQVAIFQRHHIKESCVRIVRRRKPIGGPVDARTDVGAFRGWYSTREYGAARWVDTCGPVQLLHEGCCADKSSCRSVEDIEKTVAVCLHQQTTGRPALCDIHEHR